MGRTSSPELAALWRGRLEGQPKSGLSIAAYCRREKISEGSFHFWKRRLRAPRMSGPKRTPTSTASPGGPRERSRRLPERFLQVPLSVSRSIEVHFPDGTRVQVPVDCLDALSVTVQALQSAQREGGLSHD